ncbi:MAG: argininosuccinate lyase [Dethiosulfovibrio peptidovorans]|nr:MAG: argininosuccinate lyase [Dethiosulfovibrio peptidovorans]
MWKGRFTQETDGKVQRFSQSLDLDWRLASWDIRGSLVHAEMLNRQGLISDDDLSAIRRGFQDIMDELDRGEFVPHEGLEDVHMNIEHRLTEKIGAAGARLHTGRSRNDQVGTTMRLYVKDMLAHVRVGLIRLLEALVDRAEVHQEVIVPGYTHLQQAQPVSMGHFWMAHFEAFSRDARRLEFALEASDECPLGCGALAGSTLPLDRDYTAQALGFKTPAQNSMDAVGQRDYIFDVLAFAAMFSVHCSRLAEDLILYASAEFGWVLLPDCFCTGSSMMPQKKNPDVLELVRGRTGQMVGHLVDFLVTLKGLPMTYNRDLQEDKRGLFSAFDVILLVLDVLPDLIRAVQVDADRAVESFSDGFVLATDVAEYLVVKGVPFREAHQRVGALVGWCLREGRSLFDLSLGDFQAFLGRDATEDLLPLVDVQAAVLRRETLGGTGFKQVGHQIQRGLDIITQLKGQPE